MQGNGERRLHANAEKLVLCDMMMAGARAAGSVTVLLLVVVVMVVVVVVVGTVRRLLVVAVAGMAMWGGVRRCAWRGGPLRGTDRMTRMVRVTIAFPIHTATLDQERRDALQGGSAAQEGAVLIGNSCGVRQFCWADSSGLHSPPLFQRIVRVLPIHATVVVARDYRRWQASVQQLRDQLQAQDSNQKETDRSISGLVGGVSVL